MALRDTILSNNDQIIGMVKTTNVLLSGKQASEIRAVLNDHAFPRIRMRILSATTAYVGGKGGGRNEGASIWFNNLAELSDPIVQAQVDNSIDTFIMGNPLMKDAIYSVAAKLAGSLMTSYMASQVKEQAAYAIELEKQALEDLEKLIRTPMFKESVASFKETSLKAQKIPRIFMALDVNDNVTQFSAATNIGQTFTGAVVQGLARLWIGLDEIHTAVDPGDTPAVILNRLASAWRSAQNTRNAMETDNINIIIAPDEGMPVAGTRRVQYKDYSTNPDGTPTGALQSPAIYTNMAFLQVTPYQYDKSIDFLNVTMELWSESAPGNGDFSVPGIKGLVYGVEPVYSSLTFRGPHSVVIDLTTGERVQDATTKKNEEKTLSDTFYFQLTDPGEPAMGSVSLTGSIADTETLTVTIDGQQFFATATALDNVDTLGATLASNIDATTEYSAAYDAGVISITSSTVGSPGNAITLAASTTSPTLVVTPSGTKFTGGRDMNTTPELSTITFRSQEMIDPLNDVPTEVDRLRTVNIPLGSSVLDVVLIIANDMAKFSRTSRILGAVRAPTKFMINGTPYNAPGLTIVPYTRDDIHYNVVFDVLSVPSCLRFAAMPRDMIPEANVIFDEYPKSLVISAKVYNPSGGGSSADDEPPISQSDRGRVFLAEPSESRRFSKIIKEVRRLTDV